MLVGMGSLISVVSLYCVLCMSSRNLFLVAEWPGTQSSFIMDDAKFDRFGFINF